MSIFPNIDKERVRYKGFSSKKFLEKGTFRLTDKELIKENILNHIFTSMVAGERVVMEDWGTSIPTLPFEQLDEETVVSVVEEVQRVFSMDPRVQLVSINTISDEDMNMLTLECNFSYVEFMGMDTLNVNLIYQE